MLRQTHPLFARATLAATTCIATLALVLSACSGTSSTGGSASDAGPPQAGGTLKVGIVGGSTKDTLDAHAPITHPDEARVIQLYGTLTTYDKEHQVEMDLAETITSSKDATTWTVTLRDGLKFSDGSPITADDVIATYKRITDPDNPQHGAASLSTLDRDGLKAEDERTVIFPFKEPFATFEDAVAQYVNGIVPSDYDPKKPVGSGPFMHESFTPGQQSTFAKNPNYWRADKTYLDKVTIIDFPDDTARVNALLGGQVDAIDQLPLGQISVVEANPKFKVLESETGGSLPFTMRVDQPPFDDVRVRQAFRLIVDRKQMVEQVLGGHGSVGNDMYGPLDLCYPDFPQREQDIEKAKQLLKDAGQENLSVDLVTSPVAAGIVEAAQVFAQQAKAAGVEVKVKKVDPGTFYGDQYLEWTFAQDFFYTRDYLPQMAQNSVASAPYNETHWNNPKWEAIVDEANATVDQDKRCALIEKSEAIEFNTGGYIIWGFPNSVDAHSTAVQGLEPDKSGIPLSYFGFRNVWFKK